MRDWGKTFVAWAEYDVSYCTQPKVAKMTDLHARSLITPLRETSEKSATGP